MYHYLVALGSNRWHAGHGRPRAVLGAALGALKAQGLHVMATAPVIASRPLGPSLRTYANGAVLIETDLEPPELLQLLQSIESEFGRHRRGQPWSARVLDLDIVLWSGGCWVDDDLVIPHPQFRHRRFVVGPASKIAGRWRDPLSGFTLSQVHARLTAPRALPKRRTR